MIVWKKTQGGEEEIPEPQTGLDESFDRANHVIDQIKLRLDEVLQQVRQQFKDKRVAWSHAKYRYELEIPEALVGGKLKPEHFEFTSQRKDYQRFHTREIKQLVDDLEAAEERLKDALTPFLCTLFNKFYQQKDTWNAVVNIITELDCLGSLAIVSGQQEGRMCKPKFVPYEGEYKHSSLLMLKEMRHPCVSLAQDK